MGKPKISPIIIRQSLDEAREEKCTKIFRVFISPEPCQIQVLRSGNPNEPKTINEWKSGNAENWDLDIAELDRFFKTAPIPIDPVNLNQWSRITDASLFITSHLSTVKANNGNATFLPYLNRLKEFKSIFSRLRTNLGYI
jgi:hypothetical protein